jgi:prepilin-type processing-associated H-X9-DG protein
MYCPKCGAENTEDVKLCSACGEALATQAAGSAADAKTSRLAITSLVLGISSILCAIVTAVPAIIFGIVSLVKINNSDGRLKGKGLAIAGISVSAVMLIIFVVAMLLAILMPALARTKVMAERIVCGTNIKGLVTATMIYANDYDEKLPPADKWCDLLIAEADLDEKIFCCRNQPEVSFSYALNKNLTSLIGVPGDIVLIFESNGGRNAAGGPEILAIERHKGEGCNVAFVDGHVQFVKTEDIGNLKWVP